MKKYLFTGFSSQNVVPGNVKTTLYDLDLVKCDLLNQFMTRKGERVMLPNYGTNIWDRLFEPFTEVIKGLILQDVLDVINSEPRVTIQNVNSYVVDHGIVVDVELFYIPWAVVDTLALSFNNENQNQLMVAYN